MEEHREQDGQRARAADEKAAPTHDQDASVGAEQTDGREVIQHEVDGHLRVVRRGGTARAYQPIEEDPPLGDVEQQVQSCARDPEHDHLDFGLAGRVNPHAQRTAPSDQRLNHLRRVTRFCGHRPRRDLMMRPEMVPALRRD